MGNAVFPPGVLRAGGMEGMVQWRGLEKLGLVQRVGGVSGGDGGIGEGKWRCGVGRETVMAVARGEGFDLEGYMVE